MAKKLRTISTKVPPSLFEDIEKEVDSSYYNSTSDFLRQAIREKLKEGGEGSE